MRLGDLMARVKVAGVTEQMTPDLARSILAELRRRAEPAERRELRDELLRRAAEQLEGTPWAKSKSLAAEVKASIGRNLALAIPGSVRALVIEALEVDPFTPRHWRQIHRIIR